MTGDRTEAAVQRIEQALARIARVADAPVPQTTDAAATAAPSANVLALVEKHEALRETVAQALADLDAVIGELGE
jgi:hypothetical protein